MPLSILAEIPEVSIYLIPVRLDECEMPDLAIPEFGLKLGSLHWVDLFDEDGFDRLVQAIDHALDNRSDGPTENFKPVSTVAPEKPQASEAPKLQMRSDRQVHSRGSRDSAMKAAWIGAGAVVISGALASPWLIGAFKPAPQHQQAQNEHVEPGADTPTPSASRLEAYQPFETFRSCDQDLCPETVMAPAGKFLMGSPESEAARLDAREGPQHEVTFEECDRFAEATGGEKPNDRGWGRGKCPMINVRWDTARDYCSWLGTGYRLLAEAEWEYAARAGTTTPFSFGETITPEEVNYDGNFPYGDAAIGLYRAKTVEAGSLPANDWGLHEMHGNVWEWVSDWYGRYTTSAVADPQSPANGTLRVVRGGSWTAQAKSARSVSRFRSGPGFRYSLVGFRCVRAWEELSPGKNAATGPS